jgi:predicted ATPase
MTKLNRVRIEGFRRLEALDLELRPLTVLIGANGSGKTSLLDVFTLLSASASGSLNSKLSEFAGLDHILTRGRADGLTFTVNMQLDSEPLMEYGLRLRPSGASYSIAQESLTRYEPLLSRHFKFIDATNSDIRYLDLADKLIRPNWEHNPFETSLAQVPRMYRPSEDFRRALASSTRYHAFDVGPRAPVKLPQAMRPADSPGVNGEYLVPYLYALRETDMDRFETILDTLRAAFPSFESLSFPPVAAGTLSLTWKDKNFSQPIFMHELSEGTLRFIWLTALLLSPSLGTITMIDEPEISLHPELLRLLTDLMRDASRRTQLIVATHSERLVNFLQPSEVMVLDVDDRGAALATWADSFDLSAWLEDYTLGEIWRLGQIGGRS